MDEYGRNLFWQRYKAENEQIRLEKRRVAIETCSLHISNGHAVWANWGEVHFSRPQKELIWYWGFWVNVFSGHDKIKQREEHWEALFQTGQTHDHCLCVASQVAIGYWADTDIVVGWKSCDNLWCMIAHGFAQYFLNKRHLKRKFRVISGECEHKHDWFSANFKRNWCTFSQLCNVRIWVTWWGSFVMQEKQAG